MEQRKECTTCTHKCMEAIAYNSIYCHANREYNNKEKQNSRQMIDKDNNLIYYK